MAERRTIYEPADMSISVCEYGDDPGDVTSTSTAPARSRAAAAANRTAWLNPCATMIGEDQPEREASWLRGPNDSEFMERVDLRGKLREAELKLYRAETEMTRLRQDVQRRDSVIQSLQSRARDVSLTNATQIRGEKRRSDTTKVEAENWRRKLQERENDLLEVRKERNDAVARLERELMSRDQVLSDKKEENMELKRNLRETKAAAEAQRMELDELERQLADLKRTNRDVRFDTSASKNEQERKIGALEAELRETYMKLSEAQQTVKDFDDMKKLEKVFHVKLIDVPGILLEVEQLRRDNALFRRSSEKALAMEVQVSDLQAEIDVLRRRLGEFSTLRAEKAVVDARLASWLVLAKDLALGSVAVEADADEDSLGPHVVAGAVALLQDESLKLAGKNSALQTELHALEIRLSEERASTANTKKKLVDASEEAANLRRRLTAALRQKQLVCLERDSCRRLLDSFQDDITSTFASAAAVGGGGARDGPSETDALLDEYRREVERLNGELEQMAAAGAGSAVSASASAGDVMSDNSSVSAGSAHGGNEAELLAKVETLSSANEASNREVASLRAAVGSLRNAVSARDELIRSLEAGRADRETELASLRRRLTLALSRRSSAARPPADGDEDGDAEDDSAAADEKLVLEAELEAARREAVALRKEKVDALGDQCRTVERFKELLRKKEVCEEEKARVESVAACLRTALSEAESALADAENRERAVGSDLDASRTEADTLRSCVEDMETVQRESEARLREAEAEAADLRAEVAELTAEVGRLGAELAEVRSENGALREAADRAGAELARLREDQVASAGAASEAPPDSEDKEMEEEEKVDGDERKEVTQEEEEGVAEPATDEPSTSPVKDEEMESVAEEAEDATSAVPSGSGDGREIVVRLRDNPIEWQRREREREFDMLRAEVESLRRRLAAATAAARSSSEPPSLDETTVAKEDVYSYKKIRDLKAALKRTETMSERLRKSWKETSQEFRELVYQFSGYKLDKTGADTFKLTSMYAETADDFFLLRRNSKGLIELLESDFCKANTTSFECFLTKRNSIPGFLSSVTLDLLSRETE